MNTSCIVPRGVLVLTIALAACDDRASVEPPRPVEPPIPANAWLVLSDSQARRGQEVTLSAYATMPEGGAIGSFTSRLLFDTLQLRAADPDDIGDGALRAANPMPGEFRVAGAAAQGLPGGLLFRVRLTVIDPAGLRRIGLVLDELHSSRMADLTQGLQVNDGIQALMAGRPGVRVRPVERPR